MKPAGSVHISLEKLCSCLRQHCYPDKQVANRTLRNLFHNTAQQWSCFPTFMFLYCSGHFFSAPCLCLIYLSCVSTAAAELQQAAKNNLGFGQFVLRGLEPAGGMQTQHTAKHLNPPTDRWTSATYINGACMPCLTLRNCLHPRSRLQAFIMQNCTGIIHSPITNSHVFLWLCTTMFTGLFHALYNSPENN